MVALRPVLAASFASLLLLTAGGAALSDSGKFDETRVAPTAPAKPERAAETGSSAPAAKVAQASSPEPGKENDPYRALTGKVIDAIRNLDKATNPETSDAPSSGQEAADKLRSAIDELVRHADENGKSSDYIARLVDEAVESSKVYIPIALRGADGKLDTSLLIQSVVTRSLAPAATDADTDYLAALDDEADSTVKTAAVAVPNKLTDAAAPQDKPKFVTVKAGQTLGHIAWKYYGDSLAYVKIFDANRDKIRNPNVVRVGLKLRLP